MSRRNKILYNYLINTLGISKEIVFTHINNRIDDLVSKALTGLLESKRLEKLILNQVAHIVQHGVQASWYNTQSFEGVVRQAIRAEVAKKLNEEITIEFKVVPNEASIIAKRYPDEK